MSCEDVDEVAVVLEEVQAWLAEHGGPPLDAAAIKKRVWDRVWAQREAADARRQGGHPRPLPDLLPREPLRLRVGISRSRL